MRRLTGRKPSSPRLFHAEPTESRGESQFTLPAPPFTRPIKVCEAVAALRAAWIERRSVSQVPLDSLRHL